MKFWRWLVGGEPIKSHPLEKWLPGRFVTKPLPVRVFYALRRDIPYWWRWLTFKRVFIVANSFYVSRAAAFNADYERMRIWPLIYFVEGAAGPLQFYDIDHLTKLQFDKLWKLVMDAEEEQRKKHEDDVLAADAGVDQAGSAGPGVDRGESAASGGSPAKEDSPENGGGIRA
jgi:hypothetical protein